ncbi:hypothetical protein C8R45DRAFT_1106945 [Mycena sanguinolenta]|nr:hypothetical protein C8R45DRAFT_1106945 [Mycena sanguinolenta]
MSGIPSPNPDTVVVFLAACALTLEILELEFSRRFTLPPLPSLRCLQLEFHAVLPLSVSSAIEATAHLQAEALAIVARQSEPEVLTTRPLVGRTDPAGWLGLDQRLLEMHGEVLSGDRNSRLVNVHFSLTYFKPEPKRYAKFVDDMKTLSPGILEAGLLSFSHRPSCIPPMLRFCQQQDR